MNSNREQEIDFNAERRGDYYISVGDRDETSLDLINNNEEK